ncbi:hypothetical protein IJF85_02255 [Candidatus Saccharibacteria bacterium]|nr:hypothetical protein [Candidatus Saccharibacteria bacterium]
MSAIIISASVFFLCAAILGGSWIVEMIKFVFSDKGPNYEDLDFEDQQ